MKIISSKSIKNTFQYTWWIYLLTPVLLAPLFYWSFSIYHRPTSFEKIEIFVGADVVDKSFTEKLKDKVVSDSLRLVGVSSLSPEQPRYKEKLSVVGINNCDLLILPKESVDMFEDTKEYFVELDTELSSYSSNGFYEKEDKKYGYDVSSSWLNETYINFKSDTSYYLLINVSSKNAGKYYKEGNHNENALKVTKAILEGI